MLPLDTFREIMGFNPWWFWGFSTSKVPASACNRPIPEYSWQDSDVAGRAELREALHQAQLRLAEYLNFQVEPTYLSEEVRAPKYFDNGVWRHTSASNAAGLFRGVRLSSGYIQAIGTEKHTLLKEVPVYLYDRDGDGLLDTFELTLTTTLTDPSRFAVYFNAQDRLDQEPISSRWRVQPIKVRFVSGKAVIMGRCWTIVRPILYEGYRQSGLDPNDETNYAAMLEVYDRTTETEGQTVDTSQAVLLWESLPHPSFCCCSSCTGVSYTGGEYDPASVGKAVARCGIRNAQTGHVLLGQAIRDSDGIWRARSEITYREPDRAIVRYLAGYPAESDGQMSRGFRVLVARFAAAELDGRQLNCETANKALARWQFDLARAAGANDEQYQISAGDLDCPFGTKAGHIFAWKQVRNLALP